MSDNEAGALVIENIAMLEEAIALVNGEVSEKIFQAIDFVIKDWVKENGCDGCFNWFEAETYFGALDWKIGSEAEASWIAWFVMDRRGTLDDEFNLTSCLGVRDTQIGFRFTINYGNLAKIKKYDWRKFTDQMNLEYPEIENIGFQYEPKEDGTWFLPWRLDGKLLAECYRQDTIEDAMEPIKEALENLKVSLPLFDKIIEKAQIKFGRINDGA